MAAPNRTAKVRRYLREAVLLDRPSPGAFEGVPHVCSRALYRVPQPWEEGLPEGRPERVRSRNQILGSAGAEDIFRR